MSLASFPPCVHFVSIHRRCTTCSLEIALWSSSFPSSQLDLACRYCTTTVDVAKCVIALTSSFIEHWTSDVCGPALQPEKVSLHKTWSGVCWTHSCISSVWIVCLIVCVCGWCFLQLCIGDTYHNMGFMWDLSVYKWISICFHIPGLA